MKLKAIEIEKVELQDYLDKYGEKIKFVCVWREYVSDSNSGQKVLLIIDEA